MTISQEKLNGTNLIDIKDIRFDRISVQHGLSQSAVTCMIQDVQGFMWFGTQDGLNRYDGYKFTVYKKNPGIIHSLSNNFITCLYEDREKFIWAGTSGGGLNRYDRRTDRFVNYIHQENDPSSISFNQIRSIKEDSKGNFWVGTSTGGLNRFLLNENEFIHYHCNPEDPDCIKSNSIRCIFEDSKNNLWFGTWGEGLKLFDHTSEKFIDYKNYSSDEPNANRINSIYEDSSGNIWLATNLGLHKLNKEAKTYTEFRKDDGNGLSDNLVSAVFEYEPGIFLIGTRTGGLNLFNQANEKFTSVQYSEKRSDGLSNNSIMQIFECSSGIIWIATQGGGLNKFSRNQKKIIHICQNDDKDNQLKSNKVFALHEDKDGIIWIGTNDEGIFRFDRKNNLISRYPESGKSLSDRNISFIGESKDGNLMIGTQLGGLNIINQSEQTIFVYRNETGNHGSLSHNYVTSVIEDGNNLWVSTYGGGLNKIDLKENSITHFKHEPENDASLGSNRIRTMLKSSDGNYWLGLDTGGLNRFIPGEERFIRYKHVPEKNESISGNDVLVLFEDSNRRLWAGTSGDGVNRFDIEKESFKRFRMSDGLPNETVYGILEDDSGNLWMSTNNGISRFNPLNNTFRNYDERDGYQGNEFNQGAYLKLRSGELAFGGLNGLNIFQPENICDNEHVPEIVLTGFQIFNKDAGIPGDNTPLKETIYITEEINLTYRESVFSFEFSALDFTMPEKNMYAFKMDGFDKDWNFSGWRRFATYTNLDPGKYVFRVIGSNNDGVWNKKGRSVKINISPPFWKTVWFKGLSALTLAGIAGGYYKSKINQIKKEQDAQTQFTKKLLETQEDERKRIAAELHDSLGHELLITKNKLLLTVKNPEDKESMLNDVKEVTEIISGAIQNVREISYSLHPYQIERLGFTKAIASIIERVSKHTNIKVFSNLDDADRILKPETEINLYRIVQECMNNIVKHSGADEVLINLNKGKNNISIIISDNGKGFDLHNIMMNTHGRGFGLKGMMERVKLFGGFLEIKSTPDSGTEIKITAGY